MSIKVECEFQGRTLSIETGEVARQANGAVMVRYGDTVVLVTATASKETKEGLDFFPLTVDYQEKFYAAGKIPGGFFKREAKPSSKATLTSRLIDRPIRPLFPKKYRNDVHVIATTLSVDGENEPDILSLMGASCALTISDMPFQGPIAAVRVGRLNGQYVCNPTPAQQTESDIELLVAGSKDAITMVEGGAKGVPENDILEALLFAHREMQVLIHLQNELAQKCNVTKKEFTPPMVNEPLKNKVRELSLSRFSKAMHIPDKKERSNTLSLLKKEVLETILKEVDESEKALRKSEVIEFFDEAKKKYARSYTLENKKRIDGRSYVDIRPISGKVGLLPRTHGSSLFTRGETQAIVVVTLGTGEDQQKIDSIDGESAQSFMLHYNFPPFSVGEVGPMRGPGRREIGHGSLAERALRSELPSEEKFPYTVRVVSEITESNGSSSMASVCGGTLAMMDAGVPIQSPVAGIAMGLVKEADKFAVLSDILGDEDGFGDMDFKVTGTEKGITALQMDIKINGITEEIMRVALNQAREGRLYILEKMKQIIAESRKDISQYAPRLHKLVVPKDKIRDVIGSGGKVIRNLIEVTGAKIDINDDGVVSIASADAAALEKAIQMVKDLTAEAEVGKIYQGTVKRIVDFGAFVEILPNKDGLLHISEIAHERVQRVEDFFKEGDPVEVKVLDVDREGKIRLSRKVLLEGAPPRTSEGSSENQPREYRDYRDQRGFRDRERGGGHERSGQSSRHQTLTGRESQDRRPRRTGIRKPKPRDY